MTPLLLSCLDLAIRVILSAAIIALIALAACWLWWGIRRMWYAAAFVVGRLVEHCRFMR